MMMNAPSMDPLTKTAGLMDFAVKLKSESILLHFIWLRVAHFRTKSNGQSVLIISDKQSSIAKTCVNDPAGAGYVTGELHTWAYMKSSGSATTHRCNATLKIPKICCYIFRSWLRGAIGSTSAVAHIIVRRHLLQLIFDLIVHLQGVYKRVDSP